MSGHIISLQPIQRVSIDLVAELLGRAFAGYLAPLSRDSFSPRTLEATVARDDVLLDRSYVAVLNDTPVGVALVAVRSARRGPRTRLAGMGVVPESRRMGVARALLERVVSDARGRGSPTVVLEAFARNTAAVRLYEGHGFVATRRLLGFTLAMEDPGAAASPATGLPAVTLHPTDAPALLPLFSLCASAEPAETAPSWQVEASSLARLGPSAVVYILAERGSIRPAGYVALAGDGPTARLVGLGVAPARRRQGLASAALAALRETRPDVVALSVAPLVPAQSALVPFLEMRGAVPAGEAQLEMVARL